MTVEEIVKRYLVDNGLCEPDVECGCGLNDFIPCGEITGKCQSAKHCACKDCAEVKNCDTNLFNDGCYKVAE